MAYLQRWNGAIWQDIDNGTTIKVAEVIGLDVVPVEIISQPYGQGVGDVYQRTRIPGLSFTVIMIVTGTSHQNLLTNKATLAAHFGISSLGTPSGASFILRYNAPTAAKQVTAYYAGGLEGNQKALERLLERVALRFFSPAGVWTAV
jgi:hypothetical protein